MRSRATALPQRFSRELLRIARRAAEAANPIAGEGGSSLPKSVATAFDWPLIRNASPQTRFDAVCSTVSRSPVLEPNSVRYLIEPRLELHRQRIRLRRRSACRLGREELVVGEDSHKDRISVLRERAGIDQRSLRCCRASRAKNWLSSGCSFIVSGRGTQASFGAALSRRSWPTGRSAAPPLSIATVTAAFRCPGPA